MIDIEFKETPSGLVETRGFVLEKEDEEWILYPEPALKSCCRSGDIKKGIGLRGDIPRGCKGQCVTLQGHLDGRILEVVGMEGEHFSFWWSVLLLLILFGLVCARKKGQRR